MCEFFDKAKPNEVWMEADTCLLVRHINTWFGFGNAYLGPDSPKILKPLRRILDEKGRLVVLPNFIKDLLISLIEEERGLTDLETSEVLDFINLGVYPDA